MARVKEKVASLGKRSAVMRKKPPPSCSSSCPWLGAFPHTREWGRSFLARKGARRRKRCAVMGRGVLPSSSYSFPLSLSFFSISSYWVKGLGPLLPQEGGWNLYLWGKGWRALGRSMVMGRPSSFFSFLLLIFSLFFLFLAPLRRGCGVLSPMAEGGPLSLGERDGEPLGWVRLAQPLPLTGAALCCILAVVDFKLLKGSQMEDTSSWQQSSL